MYSFSVDNSQESYIQVMQAKHGDALILHCNKSDKRGVMSKYLLLFLINSSAFFSCSMILWSSLSLASFSYSLLRSSFSFSILLRFRFI